MARAGDRYGPAAASVVALLLTILSGCGDRGQLSESEIKSAIAEALPQPKIRYDDVPYDGDGSVVAGSATDGSKITFFEVISGDAVPERTGIPDGVVAPRSSIAADGRSSDLKVRVAQGGKFPGHDINTSMSIRIEDALCNARLETNDGCGV